MAEISSFVLNVEHATVFERKMILSGIKTRQLQYKLISKCVEIKSKVIIAELMSGSLKHVGTTQVPTDLHSCIM